MSEDLKTAAVIAVHMQNDVVHAEGAFAGFFAASAAERDVIGKGSRVLAAARSAKIPVVYTIVGWDAGHDSLRTNTPLMDFVAAQKCLVKGTWQTQIVDGLEPLEGDLTLVNDRVSNFQGSPLDAILREKGVETIILFGVATNVSVESTAREATDLGYRVIIVADATSTTTEDVHAASIGSLGLFAEIISTDALAERLSA